MGSQQDAPQGRAGRDVGRLLPLALASGAAQSLLVVLTPSMVAVSESLGVSTAAVGQARTVTAAVALVTALVLLATVSVLGVRRIAVGGSVLGLLGGAAVAGASSYPLYLLAHVLVGLAVAALFTAGYAGLAGFQGPARAWAAGWVTAAAGSTWVVGNPVIGLLTEHVSWRATHLFPSAMALAVLLLGHRFSGRVALVRRGAASDLLSRPQARRWTLAETLANLGWTSVLTYVGALLIDGLGVSPATAGWLLSAGAACFVAASLLGGRVGSTVRARALVGGSTVLLAVAVVLLFGTALLGPDSRLGPASGALAFCLAAVAGGVRIPAASVLGMAQHPDRPDAMMAARTAAMQAGYLVGAPVSGWVAVGVGWQALGPVLAVALATSAVLMCSLPAGDTSPVPAGARPGGTRQGDADLVLAPQPGEVRP